LSQKCYTNIISLFQITINNNNPGHSRYGCLLRDYLGNWLVGFVGSCGLLAMSMLNFKHLYGLQMACDFGYRVIMCESDSSTALSLIEVGIPSTHPYAVIVENIVEFNHFSRKLSFSHILRQDNSSAIWLAKLDASMVVVFTIIQDCHVLIFYLHSS